MLKLLSAGLFGLLFGLNASAEGVRIEIETDRNGVRIQIETDSSDFDRSLKPSAQFFSLADEIDHAIDHADEIDHFERGHRNRYSTTEWVGPGCSGNPECEATCDDIYSRSLAKKKCRDLSTISVEKIDEVVKVLKHQRQIEQLEENLEAFRLLLHLDYKPLENAVDRMNASEKKDFLAWLASDIEATEIVSAKKSGFEILLKKLLGVNKEEIIASLNRPISGLNNFVEVALEEENDIVLYRVGEYIRYQCVPEFEYSECVFRQYCALSLDSDYEEELLFNYEFFKDILDTVLEDHRPEDAPDWWTEDVQAWDLETWNSEPNDVCKALGVGVEGSEIPPAH